MDRNLILAVALSMLVFTAWTAWEASNAPLPDPAISEFASEGESTAVEDATGDARATGSETATSAPAAPAASSPALIAADPGRVIEPWSRTFENGDVFATLSNRGGTLSGWRLNDYFQTPRRELRVELLELEAPFDVPLATPFVELGFGDLSTALYDVESSDESGVVFVLDRSGVRIRKSYRLRESSYTFDLEIEIENGSTSVISPTFEIIWPALKGEANEQDQLSLVALAAGEVERELVMGLGGSGFLGGLFSNGDDGPPTFRGAVGWAGTDLKYFTNLIVPLNDTQGVVVFETLEPGRAGKTVTRFDPSTIAPGQTVSRSFMAFLGPKEPEMLEATGHDLKLSIDRGWSWLTPLTAFFERALHFLYAFIGNYGVSIIVLTIIVRLATWPIVARQMKSSEKMREVMPRLKELQEKYKDDRQKQSEETFKLYREEGVNPLAGCFPMLLQLPVFIGLFYALQSSIDLRHAPFMLWINDLSQPATLFTLPGLDFPVRLLPLLMGGSMFAQQRMMPQTGMDPAQQKMMLIMMPGMMLFISYTFPSGLVLYWTVSNLLGIAHQLFVRRRMEAAKNEA